MSQHDFDNLLNKYLSGNCSAQEEKIILEWYEKLIAESELALSAEQKQSIEQKIWLMVAPNVQEGAVHTPKSKVVAMPSPTWYRIAIAACFILLSGLGIYWFVSRLSNRDDLAYIQVPASYIQLTNKENKTQMVRLSDGSSITLQPNSSLYYPNDFQGSTRDVYLKGNAFFSVYHNPNQHFIVHTEEGLLTEVLGTSFSIQHHPQLRKVEVAVVTGRVLVYEQKGKVSNSTKKKSVVLTPNQKVEYSFANKQLTASLVEEPTLLQNNISTNSFVFDETPIRQVVSNLEQAYGITITAENKKLENCHFTGDLSKQKLFEKLDIIVQSIQCTYEVKGTTILLMGKGCS